MGDGGLETGDGGLETGDWRRGTGDGAETGDRKQVPAPTTAVIPA
jgi:hypothetical protein